MAIHKALRTAVSFTKSAHVHQMLGVVIIVAHASEIARVVSEITMWHLLIAFALFGVWMVTQRGGSPELA
jgi:hypothetical protein